MPVTFAPASIEHEPEVRRFLAGAFKFPDGDPNFAPPAMAWKYFGDHPWWPESRSYLLQAPGGIAAHACAAPVRFDLDGHAVDSFQMIDWAAGGLVPSAGLLISRRCSEAGKGPLLAIGGSADARSVFPRQRWLARKDDMLLYARPLRPWRHLAESSRNPRALARFGRNSVWRFLPPLPDSGRWTCRPASAGERVFSHDGDFVPVLRTRAWFDYLLGCPVAGTELVVLEENGVPRGHAFLSNVRGSVRIADFVVAGAASHRDRVPAFASLIRFLAAQPEAAEVIAGSSIPEACAAFRQCGLRLRRRVPVYLADPCGALPANARLEINQLFGDNFYFTSASYPFAC